MASFENFKIGYGTWKLNGDKGLESIKTAINCGFRYIDTAQIYENEEIVGKAINDCLTNKNISRKDIFISTKLDNNIRGYQETIEAIETSLLKLNLEYADMFMLHWPKPRKYLKNWKEMNSESWKAMEYMVYEGKIKNLGVCNFLEHHLIPLLEDCKIKPIVNQIELHPYYYQNDVIKYCMSQGISIEAWSPIASGECLNDERLENIAKKYHKSISQLCIRYAIQKGCMPIVKASSKSHILDDLDVFNFKINDQDIKIIDSFRGDIRIGRHPDDE